MATKAPDGLGETVGFATLRDTYPEASAQLVEIMRATLQHAQEITAAVDEAEAATERAHSAVTTVDTLTTAPELKFVDAEIDKLTRWLNRGKEDTGFDKSVTRERTATAATVASSAHNASVASVPASPAAPTTTGAAQAAPSALSSASLPAVPAAVGSEALAMSSTPAPGGDGQGAAVPGMPGDGTPLPVPARSSSVSTVHSVAQPGRAGAMSCQGSDVSSDMVEQIETTVMWVQQLLESIHFVESDREAEPGASLLSIVQPGRRHQKEIAVAQSVNLFHEKKEEEEDAEDDAPKFRGKALQAVMARGGGGGAAASQSAFANVNVRQSTAGYQGYAAAGYGAMDGFGPEST